MMNCLQLLVLRGRVPDILFTFDFDLEFSIAGFTFDFDLEFSIAAWLYFRFFDLEFSIARSVWEITNLVVPIDGLSCMYPSGP